ncbi:SLC13 family permease [Haliea sp. E17]|uniref:SLC13 family permease n=1 Tax=Haliea sp. E17 TaxID=3401576 RepID=UPI003AAD5116
MQKWAIGVGLLLALATFGAMTAAGQDRDVAVVAGLAVLCVIWWVFEPLPIPATSLLPLALLPLFGVLTPAEVGEAYGSPVILLLLGGFLLSKAMEQSGTHRRIALGLVHLVGSDSGTRLVLGFMIASAVLSMWISNTATTLMLLPVALAVLDACSDRQKLVAPLLLGLAYAASVGGIGTPIGTPPNLIFMQVFEETTGRSISFTQWMSWGVPVVVLMIPCMALYLTRGLSGAVAVNLPAVGEWRPEEKRVMTLFLVTALAWITRVEPFGGWSGLLGLPQANDASVALIAAVFLFLLPNGRGGRLLNWEKAVEVPWGTLLLFAGGICLAKGFVNSGLSELMGGVFSNFSGFHLFALILVVALVVTFMTETTSNTASTTLLMPILAAVGMGMGIEPEILMVPAAMSASCAFMLPVATAPNSVVFGSGYLTTARMAREGLALNFIGAAIISTVCYFSLA